MRAATRHIGIDVKIHEVPFVVLGDVMALGPDPRAAIVTDLNVIGRILKIHPML